MAVPLVTLTATLQNLSGAAGAGSSLLITLAGYGNAVPSIVGNLNLATVTQTVPFVGGALSVPLWGNDVISPSGTYYCIQLLDTNGNISAAQNFQLTGSGIFDLSAITPYTPLNVPPSAILYVVTTGSNLSPAGVWSSTVGYAVGAVVSYQNSSYISLATANLNNNPATATAFWQLMASTTTLQIGSTTTGAPGSQAVVNNVGTALAQILNFTIPAGATGPQGAPFTFGGTWASGTTYANGTVVTYSGALYVSLQGGNTNQNPSTAMTYWAVGVPAGGTGATSAQVATLRGAGANSTVNICNPNAFTNGYYLNYTTGVAATLTNWSLSPQMPVVPGLQYICNQLWTATAPSGYAWFDITGAYISGQGPGLAANTLTVAAPANAAYLQFSTANAALTLATIMVCPGALPSSYLSFQMAATSDVTAAVAAATASLNNTIANGNPVNLLNPASTVIAKYCDPTSGLAMTATAGYATWGVTGLIPVVPGSQFVVNWLLTTVNSGVGLAYYLNGTYVSGVANANQAAGTVFTVPAGANQVQLTIPGPYTAASLMLVQGAALPAVTPTYNQSLAAAAAAAAATNATGLATTNTNVANLTTTVNALGSSTLPTNLFNPATAALGYYIGSGGGVLSASGAYSNYNASAAMTVVPGQRFVLNFATPAVGSGSASTGLAYYLNGTFVSGLAYSGAPTSTVYTVPVGVNQLRVTIPAIGSNVLPVLANQMVYTDIVLPAVFVPYGENLPQANAQAILALQSGSQVYSALAGKKFAIFGDSITQILSNYWQNQVATKAGMTIVYQNAHSGRATRNAFEDYSGTGVTFVSQGYQTGYVGCTVGHTLAQDLAAAAPDVIFIELGTNDATRPLGSPGDTQSSGTLYGDVNYVVSTISAAYPSAILVWITPYYYSQAAYGGGSGGGSLATITAELSAISYGCSLYSAAVVNMLVNGNLNPNNWSLYLGDGVHINPTGANHFFVPLVLAKLRELFA